MNQFLHRCVAFDGDGLSASPPVAGGRILRCDESPVAERRLEVRALKAPGDYRICSSEKTGSHLFNAFVTSAMNCSGSTEHTFV